MRTVYNISCEIGGSRNSPSAMASPTNVSRNNWSGYPEKVSSSHIINWVVSKLTFTSSSAVSMVSDVGADWIIEITQPTGWVRVMA